MEFLTSLGLLCIGTVKRLYWLIPALALDPFDFGERFFGVMYDPPTWIAWILAGVGLAVAVALTYHELRVQAKGLKAKVEDERDEASQQLQAIMSNDKTALKGDVTIYNLAEKDDPHMTSYVQFTTEGSPSRFFRTKQKPRTLRFVTHGGQVVNESDLPKEVRCGLGKLVVMKFTSEGFVLDKRDTIGERVRTDVYFATETNIMPPSSPKPVNESPTPEPEE